MAANDISEGLLLDRQLFAEQCKISARAEHGGMVVCGMWMTESDDIEAKLKLARQTWDESRHALAFYERSRELGADLDMDPPQSPVLQPLVPFLMEARTLVERTTLINLCVEVLAVESFHATKPLLDPASRELMDFILADEVTHVQLGKWVVDHFCTTPETKAKHDEYQGRVDEALAKGRQILAQQLADQAVALVGCSVAAPEVA
jgi:1,2-phenylacetyl-CoA epoxidase catalytic subunit